MLAVRKRKKQQEEKRESERLLFHIKQIPACQVLPVVFNETYAGVVG